MKKVNRDKLSFYLWGRFETIDAIVNVGLIKKKFKLTDHTHNLERKSITSYIHPHEFERVSDDIKKDIKEENLLFFLEYFVGEVYKSWKIIGYKNISLKSIYNECVKNFNEDELPFLQDN